MAEYKLSIIIPVFNLEDIIERTFHSVENQTIGFDNIEVIFIDDQSTDRTMEIIKEFKDKYHNVEIFTTDENSGFAGKPRNLGIINSNGEYLLFLDGDDQLLVDSCEVLYNHITSNNSDIAIGGHINRYEDEKLEHNPPLYSGRNETFTKVEDVNLLNITPAISAKLFKRELIAENNIRFPEGIPAQDLVFLMESILNSQRITVLNNFYVYYRNIHDKSVSFNLNEKYLTGLIGAYRHVCDIFEEHSLDGDIQEIILTNHMGFLTTQLIRSERSPDFDNQALKEIVNSESFDDLANKSIFKNNKLYVEFFENIKNGKYNNRPLLGKIRENNHNELIEKQIDWKSNYNALNNKYNTIKNENDQLQSNLAKLTDQYDDLTYYHEKLRMDNEDLKLKYDDLDNKHEELVSFNATLKNDLEMVKEEFISLEDLQIKIDDENKYLKVKNQNLKNELDEIKSSRLWRIKNKL